MSGLNDMNKRIIAVTLAGVLTFSLCACEVHPENLGINISNNNSSDADKYAEIPQEAYTFWKDETPVDEAYYEGRYYALAKGAPAGHWECTDRQLIFSEKTEYSDDDLTVRVVPKETDDDYDYDDGVFYYEGNGGEARMSAFAMFLSSSYRAGDECDPTVCFEYDTRKGSAPGKMYGAAYFADVKPGGDIFGQSISVREYFTPKYSNKVGYQQMRGYGEKTINAHNSSRRSDGGGEVTANPVADFPSIVAAGDKIWVVVDVIDGETWELGFRKCVEYTWTLDPDEPPVGMAEAVEEEHDENSVEWIKRELAGRWDLSDVRYLSSEVQEAEKSGLKVNANRYGVDGQNLCFDFEVTGESHTGEKKRLFLPFKLPYSLFNTSFYPGQGFYPDVRIFPTSDGENTPGNVKCLYALCDVENIEDPTSISVTPKYFFDTRYPRQGIQYFSPYPEGDTMRWFEYNKEFELSFDGGFPEGNEDGEKIYLVFSATDEMTGECALYNIATYTYTKGPIVVWEYIMPGY